MYSISPAQRSPRSLNTPVRSEDHALSYSQIQLPINNCDLRLAFREQRLESVQIFQQGRCIEEFATTAKVHQSLDSQYTPAAIQTKDGILHTTTAALKNMGNFFVAQNQHDWTQPHSTDLSEWVTLDEARRIFGEAPLAQAVTDQNAARLFSLADFLDSQPLKQAVIDHALNQALGNRGVFLEHRFLSLLSSLAQQEHARPLCETLLFFAYPTLDEIDLQTSIKQLSLGILPSTPIKENFDTLDKRFGVIGLEATQKNRLQDFSYFQGDKFAQLIAGIDSNLHRILRAGIEGSISTCTALFGLCENTLGQARIKNAMQFIHTSNAAALCAEPQNLLLAYKMGMSGTTYVRPLPEQKIGRLELLSLQYENPE